MNPPRSALSTGQVTALLQEKPFDPELWSGLARCLQAQNDHLSTHSVEAILSGISELNRATQDGSGKTGLAPFEPSTNATLVFGRLATSYNNPKLLKEAGILFLREWRLPNVALRLFERSMRLGGSENELRPLMDAASLAAQKLMAEKDKSLPVHTGVTTVQHAPPLVVEIIRKTGSLMLAPGLRRRAATPASAEEEKAEFVFPDTGEKCITEAMAALKERNFRKAEALLFKANEHPAADGAMWEAWSALGNASYEAEFYAEMKTAFQNAFEFNRSSLSSNFNLALAQHLNRNYDEAELGYRAADQISPRNPKVWCNMGALYFQLNEYAKAEMALCISVEADPDYARAWDNLASALGAQNKLEEALEACRKAVHLRPEFPEAYFKIGVIYFGTNLLTEAISPFERAAAASPLAPFAFAFLAALHARLEQMAAAETFVQKAIKADPACEVLWMAWNEMGNAYFTLGEYASAATSYEAATAIKPDEAEAWFSLGLTHHVMGVRDKAQKFYQQAVDLNDKYYRAWHNLGLLHAERGRHHEASEAFRAELRVNPDEARVWYDLALSLECEGLKGEAVLAYDRARTFTETIPESVPVRPTVETMEGLLVDIEKELLRLEADFTEERPDGYMVAIASRQHQTIRLSDSSGSKIIPGDRFLSKLRSLKDPGSNGPLAVYRVILST
jgi:tetratricopeptide (TPR) repeat protein